jgi:predicted RNA-binding protein YlqC (UPF0109 family)
MTERPPEFTDVDLDDEDDSERERSVQPADEPEGDAGPIEFEEEDDEEELDIEEEEDEGDEELEQGAAPQIAAPAAPYEDDETPGRAGDGVSRAAAVLKYIVENIVDEPEAISIGATTDDRGPVLLLRVAADDRGKVIGRQGRIVQAIRTVVKAATVGTGEKVSVEIID